MKNKLIFLFSIFSLLSSNLFCEPAIDACLRSWKKHPFGQSPSFRTIKGQVKVVGIGANLEDLDRTKKPELVLVKPGVAVMSKQAIRLLNPNGWYCLKGPVAVMGVSAIEAHCKAHIASSTDGVAVIGENSEAGGTAVLGAVKIERKCD
jgi:hypothetical protein